ncbi:hypothetical protein BD324DRAFT_654001 [Kockovaella imperatae]|uniref:Plasma membrane proteolipid 3 n=1 Tax=Kockovaella imperatae TaxID=4999 RepID=A0A1Y1U859_9TREE|nr:hypothetical protein BD324DRAFT_654001 [Kockovaella imperatae]ORX33706.1 hypothetical protein BD324DRAFT_654001 [Kockovaella imperatae]
MPFTCGDIVKIIFAVIFPPLGVFLERGCGADLLINILLTILGFIPGKSTRTILRARTLTIPQESSTPCTLF